MSIQRIHKPKVRQKIAFKAVMSGKTMTEAKELANYSENTTNQEVINTQGWQLLLEKHIPDESLIKVHKQGLNATKSYGGKKTPDYAVRHKYLETGYRITGKLSNNDTMNQQNNFFLNEEQMKRIASRLSVKGND